MAWKQINDIEALRIGIQSEMDSYNFYKKAIKQFTEKDAKDLLVMLAREGRKNFQLLEQQYASISGKRLLYINLPRRFHFDRPLSSDYTDLDILEMAIKHEKKGRDFYLRAATNTKDARGRAMLEELAKEKQRNLDFWQTEYSVRKKFKYNNTTTKFTTTEREKYN